MPDLSGMTYDQAVAALEEVGLYLNATGTTEGGRVFSQGVSPGDTVTVGASVEVRFTADIGSGERFGHWPRRQLGPNGRRGGYHHRGRVSPAPRK